MNDDETIHRLAWNPSAAEFDAYLKREIETARINIAFLNKNRISVPGNTLHSQSTLLRCGIVQP